MRTLSLSICLLMPITLSCGCSLGRPREPVAIFYDGESHESGAPFALDAAMRYTQERRLEWGFVKMIEKRENGRWVYFGEVPTPGRVPPEPRVLRVTGLTEVHTVSRDEYVAVWGG